MTSAGVPRGAPTFGKLDPAPAPHPRILGACRDHIIATEAFRARGLDYPHVTVATAAPEMRISLLATGRFLSIFPNSVLRFPTGRPEVKVLPVKVPVPPVPVGIVTLKNRTLSRVAQLFIDGAREVAKPLAKRKWSVTQG